MALNSYVVQYELQPQMTEQNQQESRWDFISHEANGLALKWSQM